MGAELKWLSLVLVAFSLTATAGPIWKKGAAIPVVTEGAACNPASDKVGVTSGNLILSCQSGSWIALGAGIGYGQTWQDVTASRIWGNTYTNNTGKPIEVAVNSVSGGAAPAGNLWCLVNGAMYFLSGGQYNARPSLSFIVPPGNTYLCTGNGNISLLQWSELR